MSGHIGGDSSLNRSADKSNAVAFSAPSLLMPSPEFYMTALHQRTEVNVYEDMHVPDCIATHICFAASVKNHHQ